MKENKMGYMDMKKLVLTLSIPLMISMTIQALYNVVDTLYVSRISEVGEKAINALTLANPLQMIVISLSVGLGIGINTTVSRALGQKNHEKVEKSIYNGILMGLILSVIIIFIGLFFVRGYFESQTTDLVVIDIGVKYLTIILLFSVVKIFQIIFQRLLQSTGLTHYQMITQGVAGILNIILDPIFIFYFDWGIEGAAIATIIAQFVGFGLAVYFNLTKNKELSFSGFNRSMIDIKIIKEITGTALPAALMMGLISLTSYMMNIILYQLSATYVTAYGLYVRIQSMITMPVIGIGNAIIPIIAFNVGAGHRQRVFDAIKYGVIYSAVIMAVGFVIFQIFPQQIFSIFSVSDELLAIGSTCLLISSYSFVFNGINLVLQASMQALGHATKAMIVTFIRLLVIILPLTYIFIQMDITPWYALWVSESIGLVVTILFTKISINTL